MYGTVLETGRDVHIHREMEGHPYCLLISVVNDYQGRPAALVEVGVDRWETVRQATRYRQWMIGLGWWAWCFPSVPSTSSASFSRGPSTG